MSNRKNIPAEARNIIFVPLTKLKKSPKNVRKMKHSPAEIAALAASISSLGMLQFPIIEPELTTKGKPTAIVANTIKGKGVSFMENNPKFHGTAPTPAEVVAALKELQ